MSTTRTSLLPTLACLVAALSFTPVLAAMGGGRGAVVRRAEQRVEVAVPTVDTLISHVRLDGVTDRDLMAFHFQLVATDASGAAVELPAHVRITLRFGAVGGENIIRLSGAARDVTVPRPLGVRLGRSDGLALEVSLAGYAGAGTILHVFIDHEAAQRERSRIAVSSQAMLTGSTGPGHVWEWTPATDGRLLAISGLALDHLGAVELVDAESGERVWGSDLRGASTDAPGGSALRLGVPVRAGRTYRFVVRGTEVGPATALVAMVLPSASRSIVVVP